MLHDQQPQSTSTFDYVVVGTGAAGSIVAARLSEDPGVTVCALESGPPDQVFTDPREERTRQFLRRILG